MYEADLFGVLVRGEVYPAAAPVILRLEALEDFVDVVASGQITPAVLQEKAKLLLEAK